MMSQENRARNQITKWIRRIARIWSVPIIVYSLVMVIGYTYSWVTTGVADPHAVEDYPPIENLPPILMLLGILGLAIAWRWERLGGTITVACQLAAALVSLTYRPITRDFPRSAVPVCLATIVAIPGVLFLVSGWRSSKMAISGDGGEPEAP